MCYRFAGGTGCRLLRLRHSLTSYEIGHEVTVFFSSRGIKIFGTETEENVQLTNLDVEHRIDSGNLR